MLTLDATDGSFACSAVAFSIISVAAFLLAWSQSSVIPSGSRSVPLETSGPHESGRSTPDRAVAGLGAGLPVNRALVAILMDPGRIRYSVWVSGLFAFYIGQGVLTIFLLRMRQESTRVSFRLLVHGADVVWPAVISIFATGQSNPFFLFFIFVLAAAAYRWGLRETVGTAAAAVSLMWVESLSFHLGLMSWMEGLLQRHQLPALQRGHHALRSQASFHALGLSAGAGSSAGVSGRTAEAVARRKSGDRADPESEPESKPVYRNAPGHCRRTGFHVRGQASHAGLSGSQKPPFVRG